MKEKQAHSDKLLKQKLTSITPSHPQTHKHHHNHQLIEKKLTVTKNGQLPAIHSPFLNRIVKNLFSNTEPNRRSTPSKNTNIVSRALLGNYQQAQSSNLHMFHKIFNKQSYNFTEENQENDTITSKQQKKQKSQSVKHTDLQLHREFNKLNSLAKYKQKSAILLKFHTQDQETQPMKKSIQKRSTQERQQTNHFPQATQSHLLLRHKFNRNLYSQQKNQLKKAKIHQKQLQSRMTRSINIKRYLKFSQAHAKLH